MGFSVYRTEFKEGFSALMISFIVSFYYCSTTIIYFLLRREVDATDLEDVYVGDEDDESPLGTP
ncbi:MAG TPA: hypothetical protein PKJ64_15220, partial [bacterium]|nr:hypothetical protein [bacterium]